MTATNRFKASFDDWPILDGSEYIEADLGGGVTVRAYVEIDLDAGQPSWMSEEDIAAFNADRLRFCELALMVYVGGVCVEDFAAGLCGIAIVEDAEGDGDYLTERANELLDQIDLAAIVGDFAKKAKAAAVAMKKAKGSTTTGRAARCPRPAERVDTPSGGTR